MAVFHIYVALPQLGPVLAGDMLCVTCREQTFSALGIYILVVDGPMTNRGFSDPLIRETVRVWPVQWLSIALPTGPAMCAHDLRPPPVR